MGAWDLNSTGKELLNFIKLGCSTLDRSGVRIPCISFQLMKLATGMGFGLRNS